MIFVIDDDEIMARCIGRASRQEYQIFRDGISAMAAISEGELPTMIFLDVLLNGPDGFTFLNELISYEDTAEIPVVIVSSLKLSQGQLANYNIVAALNKDEMHPAEIRRLTEGYANAK